MIAPILKDKKTDPAVVVIDDKGEHVISVLSGHIGGANELTNEVAAALKAHPLLQRHQMCKKRFRLIYSEVVLDGYGNQEKS